MATFTWAHGTTADWNVTNDWSAKKGTIPPPGSTSADIDTATLGSDKTAYAVTVSLGETFDIAALNISGYSERDDRPDYRRCALHRHGYIWRRRE